MCTLHSWAGARRNAAKLRRVFDPFWQADRPNTRRVGGIGLGLSVARRFARILDGDVVLYSIPGVGTTVTMWIPLTVPG